MFLCSACPVRFWEIGLESWHISQKIGWVSTVRAGSTHWVFLATPWFFAWTQIDWRSIQCESYVNPVLCVFEKLAYKVFKLQKTMAEFLRFVVAVLIEFYLRHPDSLHEHSLTEGQSTERELRESSSVRFCEINLQSWHISQKIGWVPIVRAGSTHWVFLMTPWFFEWTQFDWRSIQWESYVNPVLCVFEKLSYKVGIFHKKLAEFLLFVLAVLIEFSLRQPGSLHEHRLPEGQSTERVTWILSNAFLRNWLTKLANFKKQWLTSYVSWGRYSLSFPCDTLVLCMNPAWLKVNPVRELRESCPVRFWEIGLQIYHISQKFGWVPTVRAGSTHWVFFPTPWFFAWTQFAWRSIQWESYVNPVLCVFCEISLQSWHISQKNFWVPMVRAGSTHWVFLATPWFFAWTQIDWRSIQWESYVNPVLCVFEKLAYKVGIFHKTLAEFLRFVLAVLIEFSLRHPGSLNEHSLTEGQSSERVTWILSCAFLRNWLTKLAYFTKYWLSSYGSCWQYSLSFPCDTQWFFAWTQFDWRSIQWESYVNSVLCVFVKLAYKVGKFKKTHGWVPTFRGSGTHCVFLATPWFFAWIQLWLKVNLVRELRESCPVRFWEIGLQSWQISKNNGWVPTFRGDGTHWVFLATPWFFAWTQLEWRSIQWESYVNPLLCVFEKLAYKVGIFHKVLAEFLRFVLAVLIEFSFATPWFFAWTQFNWRSIQWGSYVNPHWTKTYVSTTLGIHVGMYRKCIKLS